MVDHLSSHDREPGLDFKSNVWYRFTNFIAPFNAIDVVNDNGASSSGEINMAPEGNFSGQHWQIRPSTTRPGSYNLCTMFLGASKCLDIYREDKTRPHLADAGNFSGQSWQIVSGGMGTWRLTNEYSGPLILDVKPGTDQL